MVGCVEEMLPTPSSLSFWMEAAIWSLVTPVTQGEGEKGVGAGVEGREPLAIPSSPPSCARESRMASGWRCWLGWGTAGLGVVAGAPGVARALSALSLEREAASWSGEGPRSLVRPPPPMARLGVGAGVEGAAGDLTELVELVLLLIDLSILSS